MNSRFRPYRIILPRQGGSINIIQVTVYSFTVPALKLMNVKFCLFLATTAHCHDRAAIKIHITTFNRINLHVRCGNLHNFNCFWLSIYIYIYYQGAGKRPAAQEKQIVRASPEGPRAAEQASRCSSFFFFFFFFFFSSVHYIKM